jgi:hypothetical protein
MWKIIRFFSLMRAQLEIAVFDLKAIETGEGQGMFNGN